MATITEHEMGLAHEAYQWADQLYWWVRDEPVFSEAARKRMCDDLLRIKNRAKEVEEGVEPEDSDLRR